MPQTPAIPRRNGPPGDSLTLVFIIASITAALAVVAVGASVFAVVRVGAQVERNERALTETFDTRRRGAVDACEQREALKRDLRAVLRTFDVTRDDLPASSAMDGTRALDPYPGGCAAYAQRVVPTSTKP